MISAKRKTNMNNRSAAPTSQSSRQETSLEELTKKFLTILMSNEHLTIDLKQAAKALKV